MSWLDTIFKMTPLARRNTTTPSPINGEAVELQCGPDGRLLVTTESPNTLWADGGTVIATRTIKAAAGKLYQLVIKNAGGSDQYIFFYNAIVKPADGSSAHIFTPFKVKAGEQLVLVLPRARAFSVGLTWAVSSTDATLTYDGAATFNVSAEYE